MELPQLTPEYCRLRQGRLVEAMRSEGIGRTIVTRPENVQYITGFRPNRLMFAIAALDADGGCVLVAPNEKPEGAAIDDCAVFAAQALCTLRQDQEINAAKKFLTSCKEIRATGATAIDFAGQGEILNDLLTHRDGRGATDIEPVLLRLRRKKDPDEMAMIRHAIGCTEAMYARAREVIRPGVGELEVFNELQAAAVNAAGEMLTATGNDYQCNSPGGPPRDRRAEAEELYILDLGPCYRGYYADNCRTFAVNREPTGDQVAAWESITAVLEMVEATVKPGISAKRVYEQAKEMLDVWKAGAFFHHLGHGIGLYPHEAPHLNAHWDEVFEEGDVFTAEPGLYGPELRAGIRLEQDYLVTRDGLERLTEFPLEL
jgi:Xaa-Pro dipeptidase